MSEPNRDESRDESRDPLVGFELEEIVDPVGIVHILDSLVAEGVVGVDELLEGVGQVILVREVPEFIGK